MRTQNVEISLLEGKNRDERTNRNMANTKVKVRYCRIAIGMNDVQEEVNDMVSYIFIIPGIRQDIIRR